MGNRHGAKARAPENQEGWAQPGGQKPLLLRITSGLACAGDCWRSQGFSLLKKKKKILSGRTGSAAACGIFIIFFFMWDL